MKKTVQEIIDMITNGELHYNQSTQRKFVYASTDAVIRTVQFAGILFRKKPQNKEN